MPTIFSCSEIQNTYQYINGSKVKPTLEKEGKKLIWTNQHFKHLFDKTKQNKTKHFSMN